MENQLQIRLRKLAFNYDIPLKSSHSYTSTEILVKDDEKIIIESEVTIEEDAHFEDPDVKLFSSAAQQVQILRRSKRIPLLKEKKKNCENEQISEKNCTCVNNCSNKRGRKKAKKGSKRSRNTKKSDKQTKRAYFATEIENNTTENIPECVTGIIMDSNGKRVILLKWKNKDVLDYIYEDKLTENIKKMLTVYLSNQLNELNATPSTSANKAIAEKNSVPCDEEPSSLDPEIVKDSILEFKNLQQLCVKDTQLYSNCGFDDYAVDVKLNI